MLEKSVATITFGPGPYDVDVKLNNINTLAPKKIAIAERELLKTFRSNRTKQARLWKETKQKAEAELAKEAEEVAEEQVEAVEEAEAETETE